MYCTRTIPYEYLVTTVSFDNTSTVRTKNHTILSNRTLVVVATTKLASSLQSRNDSDAVANSKLCAVATTFYIWDWYR